MTDREYEKMMVESATGQAWLKGADEMIERLEKQLAEWQEYRRELINRFNLNKPAPTNDNFDGDYRNGDFYEVTE